MIERYQQYDQQFNNKQSYQQIVAKISQLSQRILINNQKQHAYLADVTFEDHEIYYTQEE